MFKEQENLQDTRGNDQETQDEELYQRLFKKIARDFIFIGDLENIFDVFIDEIEKAQNENKSLDKNELKYYSMQSILKAIEYKNNLSKPKHKRKKYKDVPDG